MYAVSHDCNKLGVDTSNPYHACLLLIKQIMVLHQTYGHGFICYCFHLHCVATQ